jgi:NADH:ubiquinone oxidoreductase subunit 2 (subunit N)
MYMQEPRTDIPCEPLPPSLAAALIFSAAAVVWLGVYPGPVLDFATRASAGWGRALTPLLNR